MSNGHATLGATTVSTYANDLQEGEQDVHPMALLLEEMEQSLLEPQSGEIRAGVVVDKRPNEILIDIGFKSEGIVNGRELERLGEMVDELSLGDEIPVYIVREDREGNIVLSISRAQAEKDWERAEVLMESQEVFEGSVAAFNRGGVIVKLGQVRGFVPASQLSADSQSHGQGQAGEEPADDRWAGLVGEPLMLKVIDIDRKRNRLILSERQALREWRRQQKEQLLETLSDGDVYDGIISSIAEFGAFVDLGGADGLIHLSELSWNRVAHPSEVVKVGDKVKVQILSIDHERRRIGLSLRRLQPQPWDVVDQNYAVGQIVRGRITKLVNFGAFARLEQDGIEGLIHVSELTEQRINHPKEIVNEGEEHDLRIIRIDVDKRRMGLSLKQALPVEEVEVDWQIAPSSNNGGDPAAEDAGDEPRAEASAVESTADETVDAAANAEAESAEESHVLESDAVGSDTGDAQVVAEQETVR